MTHQSLKAYIAFLRQAPVTPRPPGEEWGALINRMSQTGVVCSIDEETFDYFLDVLPPKYQGYGFAFAEGAEPLRIFWNVMPDSYFCRQLTWDETKEFCRLASIPLPW